MTYLEIKLFKFVKWILRKGYGYCKERDGFSFMQEGRCAGCDASDVQDWIDGHIALIGSWCPILMTDKSSHETSKKLLELKELLRNMKFIKIE